MTVPFIDWACGSRVIPRHADQAPGRGTGGGCPRAVVVVFGSIRGFGCRAVFGRQLLGYSHPAVQSYFQFRLAETACPSPDRPLPIDHGPCLGSTALVVATKRLSHTHGGIQVKTSFAKRIDERKKKILKELAIARANRFARYMFDAQLPECFLW